MRRSVTGLRIRIRTARDFGSFRIRALLIDVLGVSGILVSLLKERRVHRALFNFALAILISESVCHGAPPEVRLMSVAQARNATQVCAREPDLSPVLADGRTVECRDFELFYTLIQLGRTSDAQLLLIGGTK